MAGRRPLTSGYGYRIHPIFGDARMHTGIDIGAPYGAPVISADAGAVVFAGAMSGYGNVVVIDHGGGWPRSMTTCPRFGVANGQSVSRGVPIGSVGCTRLLHRPSPPLRGPGQRESGRSPALYPVGETNLPGNYPVRVMETPLKIVVAALAVVVLGFGSFVLGYRVAGDGPAGDVRIDTSRPGAGLEIIEDAYEEIRTKAVDQPSEDELARAAVRAMIKVLQDQEDDPYAFFYTPKEYRSFRELTTGRFSGIGIWLKPHAKQLRIVSVLPDTPAEASGLREGDLIKTVNGIAVVDMNTDEAAARIKGPKGTTVDLEIERGDVDLAFSIVRERIDLPSVQAVMNGPDIGYIRLLTFSNGVGAQSA